MKATVSRKELSDALALAASAASQRSALPVLMSIRLEATDSGLNLLGCDGEMWASATMPANVEQPGAVCVQQKLLSDIVSVLGDAEVVFELVGTTVTMKCGMSDWRLMAMPADEFPPVPEVDAVASLEVPYGELCVAIEGVVFAAADVSTRPVLTGVLFDYNEAELKLVATDTYRLAVHTIRREGLGSKISVIVPSKALKSVRSLPLGPEEKITLRFDDQRLFVDVGSVRIVAQLLAGQYVNWERVVPQEFTRVWTLDRQDFYDNVNRALIMGRDDAYRIRFKGSGDVVVISARSEERGEAKEEVPMVAKNGDIEIAFNGRYVMDALKAMGGDGVRAEMTEASRPVVLRPADDGEERFCVVMPMAIG